VTVRHVAVAVALIAAAALAPGAALASDRDSGRTTIFTDLRVPRGNVNVVFGDASVAGVVKGDCNSIFGTCTVEDGGRVEGRVQSVTNDVARTLAPLALAGDLRSPAFGAPDGRLVGKLMSSAIVLLVFLLFPLRMRVALDRVERHPGLSAATGAIAAVALVPVGLLLLVSVVGIPLIPLEIAAAIAFVWIGKGAIGLLVGRRLYELLMPAATPSPLGALVLGLVVVSAAEIAPIVGWAVTALVWLVGFGCALLAFVRSTWLDSMLHRAPAGGAPMKSWR